MEAMNGCDVCAVKCWTPEGCLGIGKYNWKFLCMPQAPCLKKPDPPLFLGKDEKLPLILSATMGLQHMLAMCVGIATSGGMLHANEACFVWNYDSEMCSKQAFLVSCSWLASGMLTIIQVFRCRIKGTPFYLGTGLVSVMGTSFTFLPVGQSMVSSSIAEAKADNDPRCVVGPYKGSATQTTMDCRGVAVVAYGRFLGTCAVASIFELVIAFTFRTKFVREKLFPPVVVGMAIFMIGGALISSGIKYLGGGVFCGQNTQSKVIALLNVGSTVPNPSINFPTAPHSCGDAGEVRLVYGAAEYWGLGLSVIIMGVFIQIFGSPFLKSTFLFWSMMFGVIIAAFCSFHNGNTGAVLAPGAYYRSGLFDRLYGAARPAGTSGPIFSFFWSQAQFAPGFDIRYFLPCLLCSYITTAETIGDVLMTSRYSKVFDEEEIIKRQQGGIMADGFNSILACLCGSPPNTTFSQNNGIIALTRCASRSAGFGCAFWLILIGLFSPIGVMMSSIPMPVVGGVILQCFTMVAVAGMQILGPLVAVRRNGFIIMVGVAFGLGIAMEPQTMTGNGVSSFNGKNLDFNYGLWPGKMTCDVFPTKTVVTTPASCTGIPTISIVPSDADCVALGGTYTAAVTTTEPDTDCTNYNGRCCVSYNDFKKSCRTALLVVLKSPYGIAVMITIILHNLIPEEKEDDDDATFEKPTEAAHA